MAQVHGAIGRVHRGALAAGHGANNGGVHGANGGAHGELHQLVLTGAAHGWLYQLPATTPQRHYNEANMGDMARQERVEAGMEEATPTWTYSRRAEKLGKAFQNWRRRQLKILSDMQKRRSSWCAGRK